jgi:hypothetical protein
MLSVGDTNINHFNLFYIKISLHFHGVPLTVTKGRSSCERHDCILESDSTLYGYAFWTSALTECVGSASLPGLQIRQNSSQVPIKQEGWSREPNHCSSDVLLVAWLLYPSRYPGYMTLKTPKINSGTRAQFYKSFIHTTPQESTLKLLWK